MYRSDMALPPTPAGAGRAVRHVRDVLSCVFVVSNARAMMQACAWLERATLDPRPNTHSFVACRRKNGFYKDGQTRSSKAGYRDVKFAMAYRSPATKVLHGAGAGSVMGGPGQETLVEVQLALAPFHAVLCRMRPVHHLHLLATGDLRMGMQKRKI